MLRKIVEIINSVLVTANFVHCDRRAIIANLRIKKTLRSKVSSEASCFVVRTLPLSIINMQQ